MLLKLIKKKEGQKQNHVAHYDYDGNFHMISKILKLHLYLHSDNLTMYMFAKLPDTEQINDILAFQKPMVTKK